MGGAATGPENVRGRRSLDATVNLVPYVDILMTLMVFLVMCAIFTQISSLTVQSKSAGGDGVDPERASLSPVAVLVRTDAVIVERDGRRVEVARNPIEIDRALRAVVPEPGEDTLCTMRSDDGVSYGELIEIIDITRRMGLMHVSLEPTAT